MKIYLLKEELSNEKRIVIVSDNLKPIEQVWRAMKRKISSIDFKCMEKLIKKLKNLYYTEVKQRTYTENWTNKFININKS